MQSRFQKISNIHHPTDKGENRVCILKQFLENYLPRRYSIGNGEIIDSHDVCSRQCDIVIYDELNCPKLLNEKSSQVFPSESVYAVIEVKSSLDNKSLGESIENIKSVKSLSKESVLSKQLAPNVSSKGTQNPKTLGLVFAYTSNMELESITKMFSKLNKEVEMEHRINMICVLDKGLILYWDPKREMALAYSSKDYNVLCLNLNK